MAENKREIPPMYEYNTNMLAAEHERRIAMLMSVMEERARKILHPDKVDDWLKETRETISKNPHEAERKMLTLKLADVLYHGGSAYDVALAASRIECSPYINKSLTVPYVAEYVYGSKESCREYQQQVAETFKELTSYARSKHIPMKIMDLSRDLWERYDADKTGREYKPYEHMLTSAEMKIRGGVYVRPDAFENWKQLVDRAYMTGPHEVATLNSTLDILEAYECGERLQDVKDMFFLAANMTPANPRDLYYNLFEAHGGQGFGEIHSVDMLYLTDIGTRLEPEKSMPAIYMEIDERGKQFVPPHLEAEWGRAMNTYVTHGTPHTMGSVRAGIELVEAMRYGTPLEEIKRRFDEKYNNVTGYIVASVVENFGLVDGMSQYLLNDGPMPEDTRILTGPLGPEDYKNPHNWDDIGNMSDPGDLDDPSGR
ncbi:MAG: hypothetical protein IJ419_07265 [Agathobacter sp.]|nr:hypothetical protein [Agathobacter sp.]